MYCDPIVKKVRAVRQKLLRDCHNNLDELIAFVEGAAGDRHGGAPKAHPGVTVYRNAARRRTAASPQVRRHRAGAKGKT